MRIHLRKWNKSNKNFLWESRLSEMKMGEMNSPKIKMTHLGRNDSLSGKNLSLYDSLV